MDLIDKKILCSLDLNCRTPFSRIGKALRVSRNVVDYRIKNLEKSGVIQKYISSISMGSLGYKTYKICLKTRSNKKEDDFVSFISSNKQVAYFLKCEGSFDYAFTIAVRNLGELDYFLSTLKAKFSDMIDDYLVSIVIYSRIFKMDKFLLGNPKVDMKFEKHNSEGDRIELDGRDKLILTLIAENANMSLIEIASKSKLSLDVVKYKMRQLKGVVNAFRIQIDLTKLGFYHYVVLVRTKGSTVEDDKKLLSWCTMKSNVMYYSKRIGHYDFAISVAIRNLDDFNSFMTDFRKEFSGMIDSYDTLIYSKVLKLNYVPF